MKKGDYVIVREKQFNNNLKIYYTGKEIRVKIDEVFDNSIQVTQISDRYPDTPQTMSYWFDRNEIIENHESKN